MTYAMGSWKETPACNLSPQAMNGPEYRQRAVAGFQPTTLSAA